ncbi:MAG: NAD(P)(+) transhydrogenase (Re/Si-specific) subunit beta, partial [Trueperaceae bacterium]
MTVAWVDLAYVLAAILFILGLKALGRASTARRGNLLSAGGMLVAIVATLLRSGIDPLWVGIGLAVGAVVGAVAARTVQMTQMPEMVALFNGSGGIASFFVAWAEFHGDPARDVGTAAAIAAAAIIGSLAATGSVVAWGKLAGRVPSRPIRIPMQSLVTAAMAAVVLAAAVTLALVPDSGWGVAAFAVLSLLALALGALLVLPIGGADMPIVISLLNAYTGLAAAMAGFALGNSALVVAGSLVGAAGFILTQIMCKAMNRSLTNVLFG